MKELLLFLAANLDTILYVVIGAICVLVFKKALSPKQKVMITDLAKEIDDVKVKVSELIASFHEEEIPGEEKEKKVLEHININFTEKEKSTMIEKSGSILNFIKDTYIMVKPFIKLLKKV